MLIVICRQIRTGWLLEERKLVSYTSGISGQRVMHVDQMHGFVWKIFEEVFVTSLVQFNIIFPKAL